jgi:hypothetical protein
LVAQPPDRLVELREDNATFLQPPPVQQVIDYVLILWIPVSVCLQSFDKGGTYAVEIDKCSSQATNAILREQSGIDCRFQPIGGDLSSSA